MIHAAVVGLCFPADPGTITFALKTLSGVPVSDQVTSDAISTLESKNVNYYTRIGGRNITLKGVTSGGDFIDVTRSIDWLTNRIRENVFFYMASADKIPFTDAGADILVNAARQILGEALARGVIADEYTVTRPSITAVPITDRANRKFNDITITARLSGAIHNVEYNLIVSV